jgi:hypothetical protein
MCVTGRIDEVRSTISHPVALTQAMVVATVFCIFSRMCKAKSNGKLSILLSNTMDVFDCPNPMDVFDCSNPMDVFDCSNPMDLTDQGIGVKGIDHEVQMGHGS